MTRPPKDPFRAPSRPAGPQNEHALTDAVSAWLKTQEPTLWWLKVHGGPYQRAGVPDYLICIHSRFAAIELKHPIRGDDPTPAQRAQLDKIDRAGGYTRVCRSLADVQAFVGGLMRAYQHS